MGIDKNNGKYSDEELSFISENMEDINKANGKYEKEGAIEKALRLEKESKKSKQKEESNDSQNGGIISFALAILSFIAGGIVGVIFAVIALVYGFTNEKNSFSTAGIIVSVIYLGAFLLGALGIASIMVLN